MSAPAINARHINTKLRPALAAVMRKASEKRSKAKNISITYYLLEGERRVSSLLSMRSLRASANAISTRSFKSIAMNWS